MPTMSGRPECHLMWSRRWLVVLSAIWTRSRTMDGRLECHLDAVSTMDGRPECHLDVVSDDGWSSRVPFGCGLGRWVVASSVIWMRSRTMGGRLERHLDAGLGRWVVVSSVICVVSLVMQGSPWGPEGGSEGCQAAAARPRMYPDRCWSPPSALEWALGYMIRHRQRSL